jgi:hypothetical protein
MTTTFAADHLSADTRVRCGDRAQLAGEFVPVFPAVFEPLMFMRIGMGGWLLLSFAALDIALARTGHPRTPAP